MSALLCVYCLLYYFLAGVAINLGYHRALAHRAVQLPKWLERVAVILGLPAGTPVQWVGNHRFHHAHSDVAGDPHSPHMDGFWFAHVGWYIQARNPVLCFAYAIAGPVRTLVDGWHRPRSNQEHNRLATDVGGDRFYAFVSQPAPYLVMMTLHTLVFFGVAYALKGWIGIGVLWAALAVVYNLGDAIDSMAHLVGTQPYASKHKARNHWFLGILTLGEGWHANHHEFPQSARHGLLSGQPDWTWGMIRVLERVGWATHIKLPPAGAIEERSMRREGVGHVA